MLDFISNSLIYVGKIAHKYLYSYPIPVLDQGARMAI